MNELTGRTGSISLESTKAARSESIQVLPGPLSSHLDKIYASLTARSPSDFIKDVQHEEIVGNLEAANPLASLAAFRAYMASPASDALCPAKGQDLSAPITDYYISSSHNTYLTGNQLYSDAAAAAYTNVCLPGPFLPIVGLEGNESASVLTWFPHARLAQYTVEYFPFYFDLPE